MPSSFFQGPPGVSAAITANFKALFTHRSEVFLSQGRYIDPAKSRDPSNTVDVAVLQPGLIMGKITSSGLYAPSIFGLTNGALTATGTTLTLASSAIGTELARRIGATGTFKLTGPPVASGTVRTLTVTYSAISGVSVTITALGVNEVQKLNFANAPAGTFRLALVDSSGIVQYSARITYSGTIATLLANLQTATDAVLATNAIVWASPTSAIADIQATFSGTGYANLPQTLIIVDTDALTTGSVAASRLTAGVDGRFVTSSFVQPTDGSETPLSFLPDWDAGIKMTDDTGASVSGNVDFPKLPTAGEVDATQLINYPPDASLRTSLQGQLSTAAGGKFTFAGTTGVY